MSWTIVVWTMGASACLTLSAIHLFVGVRRKAPANLIFFLMGLSVAALAGFELALMKSPVPGEHGRILRWAHVPIFLMIVSLVFFVWTYLQAGRRWLGWSVIGLRALSLAVNFLVHPNLNYSRIETRPIRFLGETVFATVGDFSQRSRLAQASLVLLLIFLIDATRTVWRRGECRRAAIVGGSTVVFVFLASLLTVLIMEGGLSIPFMISLSYLGVVAAMSYELTLDVVRASDLDEDLKASEAALRESERRMSLAAEAAGVDFWVWDVSDGEYWMSERGRALRGFGKDEQLDALRFLELVHPDDRDRVRSAIDEVVRTGGTFEQEYRVVFADGKTRWIGARGRVERAPEGGIRLRGASVNITRRKIAELGVERHQLELTHLGRVSVLGEISGSLAHEINQPLAAILANAEAGLELLSQNRVSLEEIREILAEIVVADRHAGEVIRRLRMLLKKRNVEFRPLSVSEVIHDALELLRNDLLNRRVNLITEVAPDLPAVTGDSTQIQQVVVNLVTNACDAMEGNGTGDRWLSIRAAAHDDGVLVSVADRGPGIPPEKLDRLFEPFFTTKPSGLGLGLAVCRTIVAAHGGELWAVNNPEGGATFHFTLRSPAAVQPSNGRRLEESR